MAPFKPLLGLYYDNYSAGYFLRILQLSSIQECSGICEYLKSAKKILDGYVIAQPP